MGFDYKNPDSNSAGATYEEGTMIVDGQGFHEIRLNNIDNLEKEINYIYPRCLDLYKKWKFSLLEEGESSKSLAFKSSYESCKLKLDTLKNKLDEVNTSTDVKLDEIRSRTDQIDKNIFINQKKMDNQTDILKQKQERVIRNNGKIHDYIQLNNSVSTKNIILLILLIIFIIGAGMLLYFYFLPSSEN